MKEFQDWERQQKKFEYTVNKSQLAKIFEGGPDETESEGEEIPRLDKSRGVKSLLNVQEVASEETREIHLVDLKKRTKKVVKKKKKKKGHQTNVTGQKSVNDIGEISMPEDLAFD